MSLGRFAAATGFAAVLLAIVFLSSAPAETNNGAEEIFINAGSKASVFFPHRLHQETESITCQTCHDLFPQEPGGISRLKGEGTLKSRQVMNSLCIGCHRETAKAGKPSGPRSCSVCHAK